MKKVFIEGHRGACALYPENTLLSYEKAIEMGVDAFEFDIWLSKDKVPVLMHDCNPKRTCGVEGCLRDMTLEEIKKLEPYYAEKFGDKFKGQVEVPTLRELLELVKDKDYFVITTNVDHQFQRAGFDKARLFYTQGDYGLFQSVRTSNQKTYDNEEWVMKAMEAQGFIKDEDGVFRVPEDRRLQMRIPSDLIPKCPDDGSNVTTNLRADMSFVEDEGWHEASANYAHFLKKHESDHVLYLELGVGSNTPVIIKFPFWTFTYDNPDAVYACLNYNEAYAPKQIAGQSICISGDVGDVLKELTPR